MFCIFLFGIFNLKVFKIYVIHNTRKGYHDCHRS